MVKVAADENMPLVLRVCGDRVVGRPRKGVVRLAFPALEPAAAFVSSFGAMVEVLEPAEVRVELARRGAQLTHLYGLEAIPKKKAGRNGDRPVKVSSATQA
jgi:hypothetical protein